jgi:hypothetical protein
MGLFVLYYTVQSVGLFVSYCIVQSVYVPVCAVCPVQSLGLCAVLYSTVYVSVLYCTVQSLGLCAVLYRTICRFVCALF